MAKINVSKRRFSAPRGSMGNAPIHGIYDTPHQTRQLFELFPTAPNGLWQMDVTYVHLPQGQWWYIVSVIDYYSRYLLTCSLTPFQNAAAVSQALSVALQEAERIHGI